MSDQDQDQQPKTAKQVALWLNRGRALALTREKTGTKSQPQASSTYTQAEIPPTPRRYILPSKPVTKRSVAAFLWMPQIHLSLQAFSFPLALLVQTFAQILCTVGLLPADHPARSFSGAKTYGLMQVLEEARQGLPPLRTLWGNGTRMIATRQYAIFASTIGVLVTGGFTMLTMFSQMFFGAAKAFAQEPFNNVNNFSVAGDLGIGFINMIFDPSSSSVTSSGLGDLFRFYSSTMLIFAGIIVLWIIISAVAETARTGIPFGKQFNHVWAPIRLIVALGLLVPLGSGLNSGQQLVIYLTQWGSQQANQMWVKFAEKSAISGTSNGGTATTPGALGAIPMTRDSYAQVGDQLFDILLCQQIYNQISDANPDLKLEKMRVDGNLSPATAVVETMQANGTTTKVNASNYQTRKAEWAVTGQLNCGNALFTELAPQSTKSGMAAAIATAEMLSKQSNELADYITRASNLAGEVAEAAIWAQNTNNDMYGYVDFDYGKFYDGYQKHSNDFATMRAKNIQQGLQKYNSLLGLNFQDEAAKRGWISAPVWLNRIAEQNGRVLEAAGVMPVVTPPGAKLTAPSVTGQAQQVYGNIQGAWEKAQTFMLAARKAKKAEPRPDPLNQASALINQTFKNILQPNNNPLGSIGGFGRDLMSKGVDLTYRAGAMVKDSAGNMPSCIEATDSSTVCNLKENSWLGDISGALQKDVSRGSSWLVGGETMSADKVSETAMKNKLNTMSAGIMRPIGTMLISFGFMAGYVLPLLPFFRFMLGVLGWVLLLFEAVLAVPLLAISLLKTDGEGFMTQNFQTGAVMILALILRPMLMIFGLLLGLVAFNGIMNITNVSYLAAIGGVDSSDNSVISIVVYMIIYGILAYTLANSAFKAIDILPNQVMSWMGARLDSRMDDASIIHQQTSGMVNQLGMVSGMSSMGMAGAGTPKPGDPNFMGPVQTPPAAGQQSGNNPPASQNGNNLKPAGDTKE